MRKKYLSISILVMILFFVLSLGYLKVSAATSALGTIKYTYSRTILKDMTYTYTQSDNGNPQKAYVMEYNPKTTGIESYAVFGEYLFGGDTISTNIALAKTKGYKVIAGVNASPFDTSNGVTVGTTIQNGRIVCSSTGALSSTYDNFAFCEDGTAYIGHPNFKFSYKVNDGSEIVINHLNRQKKTATSYIYLISDDYYTDTTTLVESVEVVLSVTKGDLIVGTEIECKVDAVNQNSKRTKVEKGKLVLVGPNMQAMGDPKVGDTIKIKIEDNDSSFDWTKVRQTISGFYEILKDGQLVNCNTSETHPRTTLGYKEDGTVVVYVCDGRQSSALGMTDAACARYMKELGCVAAIRMDGGGSSNLSLRLPGDDFLTTVNVPSDGEERHDADAFLFVLKSDYDTTVSDSLLLHAYPNDLNVLENTVVDVVVKATDDKYNPKSVPEYQMQVEGGVGEIVEGNKFKAKGGSGKGTINITSGSASTSVNVNVTNKVDELYCTVNNLALSPNDVRSLEVKAYYLDDLLECSNEAFTWTCDSNIGTINNKGVFTAANNTGQTGYITVSFGNVSAKVLVTLGQLPVQIAGFEVGETNLNRWSNTQIGVGSGSCSINTDLKYVKFGNQSLKIDFNLAGTTGTCGTQITRSGGVSITGTPTAIGMWIYGTESAQGAWIRIQYSTGMKYADFGHVDWLGWKYVEAVFDESTTFPVSIVYLVRIMAVSESERINGTIYVDGLRAVYGFSSDDVHDPEIKNVSPASNSIVKASTTPVSFDLLDEGTGINIDATHFYLNNEEITNLQIKEIANGYNVSFTPSAFIAYKQGQNKVYVRAEDNFGNFKILEWSFTLDSSLPDFKVNITDVEVLEYNETYSLTLSSVGSSKFSSLDYHISFDTNLVEIADVTSLNDSVRATFEKVDDGVLVHLENVSSTQAKELVKIEFVPKAVGALTISHNLEYVVDGYADAIKQEFDSYTYRLEDNSLYAYMIMDLIKEEIVNFFK